MLVFASASAASTNLCTVILTTSLSSLGVKPGAGIYSITGLSSFQFGSATPAPFTNLNLGNNEQADAATAFDDNGTGNDQIGGSEEGEWTR